MSVRLATADDHLTVLRIVNGAMLEIDAKEADGKIHAGDVLVAEEGDRLLGVVVMESNEKGTHSDGAHIDAIAVLRARRGQGIGSELVDAAVERYGTLTADCDPKVRPFYESLGFEIEEREPGEVGGEKENRLRGTLESED